MKEKEELEQQKERERHIDAHKANQREAINKAGDKFELIRSLDRFEDVYETQVLWFKEHGKTLTHEEAAEKVEEFLENQISGFKDIKKIKKLFGLTDMEAKQVLDSAKKPENVETKSESVSKEPKTLTNNFTNSIEAEATDNLSDEERIQRAVARLSRKKS
jgi:ribosomal protein L7/L12